MKKSVRLTALALALGLLAMLPMAKAETTLKINLVDMPDSFRTAHPEVVIENKNHWYETTGEITTEMLLDTFDADVFTVDNDIDYQSIMEKGYCLDLSGSEIIRDAIRRLHPVFARQCMAGDKIYAVPTRIQNNYYTIDPDVLAETGLGAAEIPDTFPEFLDLAERWADHLEETPEEIALFSGVNDIVFYDEHTYALFLVNALLDNHIMQKSFAGEPLRFNEPELVEMLKRCYRLGQRLYENDQGPNVSRSIIGSGWPILGGWLQDEVILFLRLNENQPKLIDTYLTVAAAYARTENPDLSIELLEDVVQTSRAGSDSGYYTAHYLYTDAEPVLDPDHDENIASQLRNIQHTLDLLADEDLAEVDRYDLEEGLKRQQAILQDIQENEERKYDISPRRLKFFSAHAGEMCVLKPGVFYANNNNPETSDNFHQLKKRFVAGQISAEELVNELDRIAQMVERESE